MSDEEFADWFLHAVDRVGDAVPDRMQWRLLSGRQDEHRYAESTQGFLNKLHTANLLLQGQTEAYRMVMDAEDVDTLSGSKSNEGMEGWSMHAQASPSRAAKLWKKVREQTLKGNDIWQVGSYSEELSRKHSVH